MRLHLHALRILTAGVVLSAVLLTGCSGGGGGGGEAPSSSTTPNLPSSSSSSSSSSSGSSSSSSSISSSNSDAEEPQAHIMWKYTKKSDGTIKLTGYDKTAAIVPEGELIIPDKYDGYVVSEIGYECLYQNNDIEASSFRRR